MPDKDQLLNQTVSLVILAVAMLAIIFLVRQNHVMQINKQITLLEQQIRELQHENDQLEIELARYTSLEYLDKEAVNRLKMIRPTQVRFILKNKLERLP